MLTSDAEQKIISLTEKLQARELSVDEMVPTIERLKSDIYTANRSLKSTQKDLKQKSEALEESRLLVVKLSADNKELQQANKILESQLDKTTKKLNKHDEQYEKEREAFLDANVKMELAHDHVKNLTEQLNQWKRRSEQNSMNWARERQRLISQIDNGKRELEDFDKNANWAIAENARMKMDLVTNTEKLDEAHKMIQDFKD